jgi:hypothetical protein
MAVEIEISQTDIQDAQDFLETYLTEQVAEGNFQEGSALRDLAINAIAAVYAYLRGEADLMSKLQSLLRIREELAEQDVTDVESEDVSQAVDEVMSNWFVNRKGGQTSRGIAYLHFTQRATINIDRSTKFWRTSTLAFYVDTTAEQYVIPETSLTPQFDSSGRLIDYTAIVPLRSALQSEDYDLVPGRFFSVDAPSGLPYFTYAENREKFSGGSGVENSTDIIDRADTAISIRNLINNRSIDVTLQEEYPEISETTTIGMGEPEMVRDRRTEIAAHIRLHTGGHYDTYLELPISRVEENGTVGGYFARPDGVINVFRDPELTYDLGTPFTALGAQAGHILMIQSGILGVPRGFQIVDVTEHELFVSEYTAFPEASDEKLVNEVVYTIGWFYPSYNQLELEPGLYVRTATRSTNPIYASIPAGTSRHINRPGYIVLSGRPVQDILSVEVTDPDSGDSIFIDPSTGTLKFPIRVNGPPIVGSILGTSQYQVEVFNPSKSQSAEALTAIRVGYYSDPVKFDGKNLKVVYQSLTGFGPIHEYVTNVNARVAAANYLLRARHPIWISMTIPYRYKPTAIDTIDETEAAETLAQHINTFDPNDDLDMSDIATAFREAYDAVGTVFPFDITYYLYSPDGQLIEYLTTDIVSIFINGSSGVSLENSSDIIVPNAMQSQGYTEISTPEELRTYYDLYGVTDRTVKYRSRADLISFVLQG